MPICPDLPCAQRNWLDSSQPSSEPRGFRPSGAAATCPAPSFSGSEFPTGGGALQQHFVTPTWLSRLPAFPPFRWNSFFTQISPSLYPCGEWQSAGEWERGAGAQWERSARSFKSRRRPPAAFLNLLGHPHPSRVLRPRVRSPQVNPRTRCLAPCRTGEAGVAPEPRNQDALRGQPSCPSPPGNWLDPTLPGAIYRRARLALQSTLRPASEASGDAGSSRLS